jgi:hypothetical protein
MDRGALRRGTRITIWLLAGLAVLAFVGGCDLLGGETMTKEGRVDAFMSDLKSNNWGSLYTHIHPNHPNRGQLKDPQSWNPAPFRDNASFTYSNYSESGDTVTITVDDADDEYDGPWTFSMKEDTSDLWYIDGLTGPGGQDFLAVQ